MAGYIDHTVLPGYAVEGKYCLVLYSGERKWHERYVISRALPCQDERSIGWCVVATPDGDVYGEPLCPPSVSGVAVLQDDRSLPPGLLRRNVYRFEDGQVGHAPAGAELQHLRGAAAAELAALQSEIDALGGGSGIVGPVASSAAAPPAAAPPPLSPPGPVLAPAAGFVWVVASSEKQYARGSMVPLQTVVGGYQAGSKGVAALSDGTVLFAELIANQDLMRYVSPEPPAVAASPLVQGGGAVAMNQDDARTLAVRYSSEGKRRRELREGVELVSESSWGDWPIKGPRTAKWVGQYIVTNGGSPLTMHNTWKSNCKLQPSDNGVLEHESICKDLELALEYDQLNLGELACLELLCRQLQMLQYRWKERILGATSAGTVDDESHFFSVLTRLGATYALPLPLTLGWERSFTRRVKPTRSKGKPARSGRCSGATSRNLRDAEGVLLCAASALAGLRCASFSSAWF